MFIVAARMANYALMKSSWSYGEAWATFLAECRQCATPVAREELAKSFKDTWPTELPAPCMLEAVKRRLDFFFHVVQRGVAKCHAIHPQLGESPTSTTTHLYIHDQLRMLALCSTICV